MSRPKFVSKEFLEQEHIINKKSLNQIEKETGISRPTLKKYLLQHELTYHKTNEKVRLFDNKELLIQYHHIEKKTLKEISAILHTTQTHVTNWFRHHNIKVVDYQKIPIPPKEDLMNLYFDKCKTFVELAEIYNTTNVTVRNWFRKYDISVRTHRENQQNVMKSWAEKQDIFPSQKHIPQESLKILNDRELFIKEFNKYENRHEFSKNLKVSYNVIEKRITQYNCHDDLKKVCGTSKEEIQIRDFVSYYVDKIEKNYDLFTNLVGRIKNEDARTILLDFSKEIKDRLAAAPASTRVEYVGAYPGGLVEYSLNVLRLAKDLNKTFDANLDSDSLIITSLFHDIGKIGDAKNDYYVEQESDWHKTKLGMMYDFNPAVPRIPVCHRSLWWLNSVGCPLSADEVTAISSLHHVGQMYSSELYEAPMLSVVLQTAVRVACIKGKGKTSILG